MVPHTDKDAIMESMLFDLFIWEMQILLETFPAFDKFDTTNAIEVQNDTNNCSVNQD